MLAKEDNSGNKRLVGYIVSSEAFDRQAIQNYLNTKLPEYMVPALWIELEIIPLTPNGKVDRKALPDPEGTMATGAYIAPRNETESKLTEIWQELLEMENVGMTDDVFELGGHSLLAMRLVSVIRKTFETELQINDVFSYPTISSLGAYLDEQNKGALPPDHSINANGRNISHYRSARSVYGSSTGWRGAYSTICRRCCG